MQHGLPFDTHVICGVPVLHWHGDFSRATVAQCQQILHALTRNGYREIVIDLVRALGAPRELQRLLSTLDKILPAHTHAEIVLPAGSSPARYPKRMHLAQSVALALSHITRLPAASLQAAVPTHVRWQEDER